MKPVFTIVIPVYNADKYLSQTLNSIRNQLFSEFEVLLIDDGSTDESAEVCLDFVNIDNRFQLYRKNNGGVCSARNYGIEKAKGEYIVFVDADDVVESTMLLECIKKIRNSKADILLFGMKFDIEKKKEIVKSYQKSFESVVFLGEELDTYYCKLYESNYITSMCNRVTKLELIQSNNLQFNEKITNYEDMVFGLECLRYAQKIQCIEECYYHYILRDEFGMSRKYKECLSETLPETVNLLRTNLGSLPLSQETKEWAYRDIQRILWIGIANICRQHTNIWGKRRAIRELCMQPWVDKMLPMESTGNKYNDLCVMFYKRKWWIAETLWNIFSNYFRDFRY